MPREQQLTPRPPPQSTTMWGYPSLVEHLATLEPELQRETVRYLARTDLYFLMRYVLGRKDVEHPWIFSRIKVVERDPDGRIDLWARDHYKSSIVTFGKTIQDILGSHGDNPLIRYKGREQTFGIFSHTRPIAKSFLQQIMREFEQNEDLKELFPDILWARPKVQAPKWSEDQGLIVRRRTNPKEATVEAWGLVDGQPISKHWENLLYDDVVVPGSVTTPEMIQKTTKAWELSLALGTRKAKHRYVGTRYHHNDTWRQIMDRKAAIPRIVPATRDGTPTGEPVFLSREELDDKRRKMGPYTFASQMLLNPTADSLQNFQREWFMRYGNMKNHRAMNLYLLVDPANETKRTSDYTAMAVVGLGPDQNYYLVDAIRDRLSLPQRAKMVMDLHRKWKPKGVGYEKYGKDADIDHIRHVMDQENYRFHITQLPRPGAPRLKKVDRINRLLPDMSDERWWFPEVLWYTNHEGLTVDIMGQLIEEELIPMPVPVHDDLADAMSRIYDMQTTWPKETRPRGRDRYAEGAKSGRTYMSA